MIEFIILVIIILIIILAKEHFGNSYESKAEFVDDRADFDKAEQKFYARYKL